MDIVSPVVTFDIGAVAPNNPTVKNKINIAVERSTSFINNLLQPLFVSYMEKINSLKNYSTYEADLDPIECADILDEIVDLGLSKEIELYNKLDEEDAIIFYDGVYFCIVDDEGLDYDDEDDVVEMFMTNHISSIRKVHRSVRHKYQDKLDTHIIVFTNFLITIKELPFTKWYVLLDENGGIKMLK